MFRKIKPKTQRRLIGGHRRMLQRQQRLAELEEVCAEAYQVVGSLLDDLGHFGTAEADKILDNLAEGRLVHKDVLPWEKVPTVPAGCDGIGYDGRNTVNLYFETHEQALAHFDRIQRHFP